MLKTLKYCLYVFGKELTFIKSLKTLMSNQTWIGGPKTLEGEDLVHKCKVPVSGFVHSHSELQRPPWFHYTSQVTAPELLSIFLTFWPSWPFEYKWNHFIIVILWDLWVTYCCNFMNSWVMSKSVLYQVPMTFDLWPLIFYHFIFKSIYESCFFFFFGPRSTHVALILSIRLPLYLKGDTLRFFLCVSFLWLCDIMLCHNVTHNLCLAASLALEH